MSDPLNTQQLQQDLAELLAQRWRDELHHTTTFDVTVAHQSGRVQCSFVVHNAEEDFRLALEGQLEYSRARLSPEDALDRVVDTLDHYVALFVANPIRAPLAPRWTQVALSRRVVISVRGELTRPRLEAEAEQLLAKTPQQ